ncbi:MAG: M56 family metallopeptidase, partial [bacterium]|nr:M56 family metallopeptidase [bacterium]
MSFPNLMANLGAYALQVGLLMAVGLVLPRLLGVRQPLLRLRYWQGLLAVTLLLPLLQPWHTPDAGVGALATIDLRAEPAVPAAEAGLGWFPSPPLLLLLVAVVALGRLLWLLAGLWTLGRYRREAALLRPLPQEVAVIQERLATRAEILLSDRVSTPVTFGWRRPAILVPRAFQRMSPGEQRGIACHELLHVRRRDWPALILEEILKSLAWFHPGVWILLGRIALSREQVVDREVVRITREKRTYLDALWSIARDRRPSAALVGLAFFQRSQLFHRVAMMTREVSMSRPRLLTTVSALTGLLALTLVFGTAAFPLMTEPEPA